MVFSVIGIVSGIGHELVEPGIPKVVYVAVLIKARQALLDIPSAVVSDVIVC
jgi:hypothetical protein